MISPATIDELFSAAEACVPWEMCGLLFSEGRFTRASNHAEDPTHAFVIAPEAYVKASMLMDGKPWALVHSHPTKGARPSVKDCQLMDELAACGQDLTMIIVGLDPREIRAYKKNKHVYECIMAHVPGKLYWQIGAMEYRVTFIQG